MYNLLTFASDIIMNAHTQKMLTRLKSNQWSEVMPNWNKPRYGKTMDIGAYEYENKWLLFQGVEFGCTLLHNDVLIIAYYCHKHM